MRRSGSVHAAIAATPAVRIVEIPIHIGICASASSVNDGAAALASEPTASSTLATPSSARGEYRVEQPPGDERGDDRERRGEDPQLPRRGDRDPEVVGDVAQDRREDEHAGLARDEREEEHERRRREGVAAGRAR